MVLYLGTEYGTALAWRGFHASVIVTIGTGICVLRQKIPRIVPSTQQVWRRHEFKI